MSSYSFRPAVIDPTNWIYQYIKYARECTDAPHEYHEAYALLLLAIATQGLKLELVSHPKGLATNLYLLIFGQSSLMRKSTAMELATEIQDRALPGVRLPENFTPGGLEEALAERSNQPSALFIDEFTGLIERMHHQTYMAGTRPFLLTMYAGGNWTYTRRAKGGKKDDIPITKPHLCIAGNVTPAISKRLNGADIEDGFLARFGIIAPTHKPARINLFDMKLVDRNKRADIWMGLERIHNLAADAKEHPPNVDVEPAALSVIDRFQTELEHRQKRMEDHAIVMTERLGDMAMKTAMLIAAGRPEGFRLKRLMVNPSDAEQAVALMLKWVEWAVDFAATISRTKMDVYIRRVVRWLQENGGEAPRWDLCRRLGFDKRLADDVQFTMIDQNLLRVRETASENGAKPKLVWLLNEDGLQERKPLTVTEAPEA